MRVMMATLLVVSLAVSVLAGCGKTGDLYLPQRTGEVVTRPPPAPPESGETSSSPQSVDSPASPANPAPEVTEPESKKRRDGANSPPR